MGLRQSHAQARLYISLNDPEPPQSDLMNPLQGVILMLKFLGSTIGIIFLIGLLVVIGLFALIF